MIFLQVTLKVFMLDLVIQVWNRRMVVNTLPRRLTIDERGAFGEIVVGQRLGNPRRGCLGLDFACADATQ